MNFLFFQKDREIFSYFLSQLRRSPTQTTKKPQFLLVAPATDVPLDILQKFLYRYISTNLISWVQSLQCFYTTLLRNNQSQLIRHTMCGMKSSPLFRPPPSIYISVFLIFHRAGKLCSYRTKKKSYIMYTSPGDRNNRSKVSKRSETDGRKINAYVK